MMPNKKTGENKKSRGTTLGVRINDDERAVMEKKAIQYGFDYLAEYLREIGLHGVFRKEREKRIDEP